MKIEEWRCIICKARLGHVENGKIIRVKRRDFAIEIHTQPGCHVIMGCYRCGKSNDISDQDEVQDITS
jgi:hypothetical protein